MGRKVLGLDIGITSVGYGVIDIDDNSIVDFGVRLFKEGTAAENETRREKRGSKRLKSRRKTRRDDLKKLLIKNNIINDSFIMLANPYDLRIRGLTNKLRNDELATALFQICKHRGSSLETVEEDETKNKDLGETKKVLKENDHLLDEGYFICQIQKKKLDEKGKIRGNSNNFRTKDYVAELKQILSNQQLDDNLNNEIIKIISRKRHFSDGPGSEKSPTKYGQWYYENGVLKHVNLIEKMRGKCSVYPNELRAPKMSYSADLFNLLNDLNNLTFNNEKMNRSQKEEVIKIINDKGNVTPLQLAKLLDVDLADISGFRINNNDMPILTEFKGYKMIKKVFTNNGQLELLEDKTLVDNIVDVLTKTKAVQERIDEIHEINVSICEKTLEELSTLRGISGYHSLSFKALHEISDEMLITEMNQMQILQSSIFVKEDKKNHKGKKKIYADDTAILSPVAKRAQRETMKVINRLREIYGEFDSIVVETAREKNSDEQKKSKRETQKYYEKKNKEVQDAVGENTIINAKTKEKIRLYLEQDGKCAYTLESLSIVDIINDPEAYEVDHIIPISISLDDSINNKVLVTHKANQDKGNLTPVAAFNRGKLNECSIQQFKANALQLRKTNKISRKKLEYLLFEKDITKYDVMKNFISRNLVDTSYANRVVFNTLSSYFKQNEIDTKVHTIKGSATNQFRKRIKLKKDREEDYGHHAIDALIVASLKKQNTINNLLNNYKIDEVYNHETGEIISIEDENKYFDEKYISFLAQLKNLEVTKFSHKIDTKPNRRVAKETIYSTRIVDKNEKLVRKFENIYGEDDGKKIADDIINKKYREKYLMAQHDQQTFDILKIIVENSFDKYKDNSEYVKKDTKKNEYNFKINPFAEYKDEFGKIRKYSKKGNGPYITQMKYYDGNLGNHINVSKNYLVDDKKVVLLKISPYRTDFYLSKKGFYKFVTIYYKDVKYEQSKNLYVIDKGWYENEKIKKGIDNTFDYQFSMHRDELIGITKKAGEPMIVSNNDLVHNGSTVEIVRFTATNDDNSNKVEVKPINKYVTKQLKVSIGKKILCLKKYSTDVVGNVYEVKNSVLKLEF